MSESRLFRCFTEKREGFDLAARALLARLRAELGIHTLDNVRVLCRYDAQGLDEQTYARAVAGVFSEPACDRVWHERFDQPPDAFVLIVEALPGQFDMRADSCAQCIALMTQGERPLVRAATVYVFEGALSPDERAAIERTLINPLEARRGTTHKPATLELPFDAPPDLPTLDGFTARTDDEAALREYGLAMDAQDLAFVRAHFAREGRQPTETELRVIDTYWSDHCRHTTFLTALTGADIQDPAVAASFEEYMAARRELYGDDDTRPVTLMDIATCAAKTLKKRGILKGLDESDEVNACSVKITARIDGEERPWLLMFKNETHNHPTEIEPFGGAATCLGGAIRDPLSGRAYVYQAMRVSGAADPRRPLSDTLPGKLPQRVICRGAAAGYSSYGNQIGLATGLVAEVYHENYVAKRLETGAVVAAAPAENVVRLTPAPGDVVLLLGGRTGRDGCGGATGSSKSHTEDSLATCGAEVQKGNAPEERKIQRLFRDPAAARMIKRCNDFGAGGVCVAIGELADGLCVDLDKVPKKYDGLNGTELAISESQERMAVVVAGQDADAFIRLAAAENLEATPVATVTEQKRLVMTWRGQTVCDLSREFLSSNGAPKSGTVSVAAQTPVRGELRPEARDVRARTLSLLADLNICLNRGLTARFDSTVGAASVLVPFGGKNQLTPAQVMAAKLPVTDGETDTASVMAYGFDPAHMAQSPYYGAQASVLSSVAKLVAAGCDPNKVYLSFQEFFERPNGKPERLGKPFAALLGAFSAQMALRAAAIGGKDSMSGTFGDIDVPPTLISFAVSVKDAGAVLSPEFKAPGGMVYYFKAPYNAGAPDLSGAERLFERVSALIKTGTVRAAWAVSGGGVIEGLCKMAIGNDIGFTLDADADVSALFESNYGGILVETSEACPFGVRLGMTSERPEIALHQTRLPLSEIKRALTGTLEEIYPTRAPETDGRAVREVTDTRRYAPRRAAPVTRPLAVIPVFPGTNCEYDTQRAVERAGGQARLVLVRNLTPDMMKQSAHELCEALAAAHMLILPGGFSGGDEPDGSGKFIQAFFRNPALTDAVHRLLHVRDGLALGICNGFQALIKLGLLPFGEIRALDDGCPTLTFNAIGRHQSCYAHTRVASTLSPWLSKCQTGDVHTIAFSHGEGRFMADERTLETLIAGGQIAAQYCTAQGVPSMDIEVNPNGSRLAIEAISSPDGRVLGKMGHSERYGPHVAKNIPGRKFQPLFEGGVAYFKE